MGFFSSILSKLGFGEQAVAAAEQAPSAPTAPAPAAGPTAISEIDVLGQLEALAASHAEKLNWKVSIVDLMKLLGLDSSLAARKALATELGCPPDQMADTAQMNMWLHRAVMKKLAENGGSIPPELLH